eukprot:11779989-Alexandrium_andersonii.AAC.1
MRTAWRSSSPWKSRPPKQPRQHRPQRSASPGRSTCPQAGCRSCSTVRSMGLIAKARNSADVVFARSA